MACRPRGRFWRCAGNCRSVSKGVKCGSMPGVCVKIGVSTSRKPFSLKKIRTAWFKAARAMAIFRRFCIVAVLFLILRSSQGCGSIRIYGFQTS